MTTQIDLAVSTLTNKVMQVFSVNSNFHIYTAWKADPGADAAWVPWVRFPGFVKVLTAGHLQDGRPYLLGLSPEGVLSSMWKLSTAASDAWSAWTPFGGPNFVEIAIVPLVHGGAQLFGILSDGTIQTCWDVSDGTSPDWWPWEPFPGELKKITFGTLSDGRPQLFGIAPDGTLMTCWKVSLDVSAAWSDWATFGSAMLRDITAFQLEDGALQLFAVHRFGQVTTCWKTSHDPDAAWTAWEHFDGVLNGIASGRLPDKRAQLFGIMSDGSLSTTFKKTTSTAAAWTGWTPFDPGAPPPPPLNCRFNLESFYVLKLRSRSRDTVFVSVSLAIGPFAPQSRTLAVGEVGTGLHNTNLSFDNIQMNDTDSAVLTFALVNNGHGDPGIVVKQLEDATKMLAQKGADAIATAAGTAIGAAIGASIGTAAVPIIGTALGALAGWIVDETGTLLFANCDGPVAAGVHIFNGAQLRDLGFERQDDFNPGMDSAAGCGDNSEYTVTWTVEAR